MGAIRITSNSKTFKHRCTYLLSLTVILISGIWVPTSLIAHGHNLQKHFNPLRSASFQNLHLSECSGFKMVLLLIHKGANSNTCVHPTAALELYFKQSVYLEIMPINIKPKGRSQSCIYMLHEFTNQRQLCSPLLPVTEYKDTRISSQSTVIKTWDSWKQGRSISITRCPSGFPT